MPRYSENTTVTVADGVMTQSLPDGEVVLLDMGSESYFGLDGAGARMWTELVDGKTVGEVVEVVAGEFDASADVLRDDLTDLIGQLVEAGLAAPSETD